MVVIWYFQSSKSSSVVRGQHLLTEGSNRLASDLAVHLCIVLSGPAVSRKVL